MLFYLILFIFLIFLLIIFFSTLIPLFTNEPPFVPVSFKIVRGMLFLAELKEGETVYDLGCGDGRIVVEAGRKYEVKAIGVEKYLGIWFLANLRNLLFGLPARILLQDIFKVDLKNADVVFCYLFPETMEKLKRKFVSELKPGSRIISYIFEIKGWQPKNIKKIGKNKIYVYQI